METAQLPDNQWMHVAITLGNGTAKLFVNGTLKATSSGVTIKPSDFQPGSNYIGKSQFATDPLFNGMIDEFRVYNRVLSDAEIGAVYNQTGYGADKSLLTFLLDQAAAAGNAGIYTADSLQTLQEAIPAAQAIASDTGASQDQVDGAVDSLRSAYEGLAYLPGVPAIAPVMDKTVIAGNQIAFKLHQLNSVAGTVFSVSGLPQGAVFDADKRTVVWTPNKTQGGFYNVILTAEANGGATSRTVKLTVKGQPVITPNETVELTSRQPFTYQVKATDPTGATLTYSAAKLPSGAALDPVTGVFTWTPTHANYGDNIVTFIVSNGLYKISQTVDFKVNFGNLPPDDYTKGSYYLYHKVVERILAAIALPGADKDVLVAELIQAEGLLVRVPLSLYSFEGNAQNSFGSTTATIAGNAAYAAGSVGQAISLNGTDSYVALPAAHPLSTYDEITLTTSVYWNGSSQWQRIFDFGNNTNQYMFLTPRSGGNTLRFAIKNGGGEQFVETSQLATGQWAHVAVTLGGGTAKLYVNGDLKATKSGFTIKPSDFKPSKNYIGKSQFSDPLFNGMIDEFQIYNYAMSAEEIQAVYSNGAQWIDYSLLTVLLEEVALLDASLYTEGSWNALEASLSNAAALPSDASQEKIDAASEGLLAALEGLQWKDITASLDPAAPSGKNGWFTSPVTVTLSPAKIAEYSLDSGDTWTAYSEPVVLDQEGTHQVQYRRSVDTGETSSLEAKIDLSAPMVQIMGEASYTIDQTVTITCSANDVISSVYGTPCDQPLLQVKAYTLESGEHTTMVTVEDMAGNQTTVDHTFTVMVTFDSLKTVTNVFLQETNAKVWNTVAKSYNQKLDQAKAAAGQGKIDAAKSMMADYIKQVTDQTGKYFTQEQADILIRWAQIVI